MPKFQDSEDPILDRGGVVLYDRFGFENIPQDTRFVQVRRSSTPLAGGLVVGGVYTPKEPLSIDKYTLYRSVLHLRSEVSLATPELNPRVSARISPWEATTARHCFFILSNANQDYSSRILTFLDSNGNDSLHFSEAAALELFRSVPNVIPSSKTQDIQTRVFSESTTVKKIRNLQYRDGYLFSNRALHPRCKTNFYDSFNSYLSGLESAYHLPEERPIRDIPASSPERTEVPTPESEPATPDLPMPPDEEAVAADFANSVIFGSPRVFTTVSTDSIPHTTYTTFNTFNSFNQ